MSPLNIGQPKQIDWSGTGDSIASGSKSLFVSIKDASKKVIAGGVPALFNDTETPLTFSSAAKQGMDWRKKKMDEQFSTENVGDTALNFSPMSPVAGAVKKVATPLITEVYKESGPLTTKILKALEGKTTVSKQFISDLTNSGELKQSERDLIRNVLDTEKTSIVGVKSFADKVKSELLPLNLSKGNEFERKGAGIPLRYESRALDPDIRGSVANYDEHIYESPIKTSAGSKHFGQTSDNYFGHTRVEDMADNQTRRVIEVQSDLYQKGSLEKSVAQTSGKTLGEYGDITTLRKSLQNDRDLLKYAKETGKSSESIKKLEDTIKEKELQISKPESDIAKLQQYNNPTAHFRMVREEMKKAAEDGKTKLQFPTGETAMKIEGLGQQGADRWVVTSEMSRGSFSDMKLTPEKIKVGQSIQGFGHDGEWIVTSNLGDGKFKAVPKSYVNDRANSIRPGSMEEYNKLLSQIDTDGSVVEQFDISGKVDPNNPIYKFYEKDMQQYLKKFGGKQVVDDKGVSWIEVPVDPSKAGMPVEAFAAAPIALSSTQSKDEKKKNPFAGAIKKAKDLFVGHEYYNRATDDPQMQKQLDKEEYKISDRPVKILHKELPELGGVLFGEANANIDEMRKIANVVINRANKSNKTILAELTKRTKNGGFEFNAYGGKQYNLYRTGNLDAPSKAKAAMVEQVLKEIQNGTLKDNTDNAIFFSHDANGNLATTTDLNDNIRHAHGIKP